MKIWNETNLAIEAAKAAGAKIMCVYESEFKTEYKQDSGGEITEADLSSQRTIVEFLNQTNLSILSEEAEDNKSRLKSERIWIVDPLDGTADFVARTGDFSVMIALVEKNVPIMGLIYQPTNDILYLAQKGEGAWKKTGGDWKRIEVSSIERLADSRVVLSRHHFAPPDKHLAYALGAKEYLYRGSAGIKAGMVAEGSADIYVTATSKMKHWDTAASVCLVSEAGGRVTDLLGETLAFNTEDFHHRNGILMSNAKIHGKVLEILKDEKL